ncbi:protein-L-isoaspartate O-methyltransferase family protein [Kordiimonas lacus]|uniref:Protein-L-isoaspartate O-methyltransferase n=1 Tax=Kordiimonas lacus TaxID=637679 RepID=A0A1G6VND2_9PROT|nr:protein-L-isoaspartate O-methyltransferase [Kordiimonas lacus]SDD55098.1 protein-L-isoaspartate(D-aspartate) O-methyltransferase [Kordiimonas lacus]
MTQAAVARSHMIDCQLRPNEVNDERIISAIEGVARELFVPKAKRSIAYVDEDLDIGEGRFLMEPMIFARLVTAAEIGPKDLVLDIGCATGYSAAVIANLADAVVALEENEKFATAAEKKLSDQGVMNVAVMNGKHRDGVAKQGPFDVIIIEGMVEDVPEALVQQLKDGGRLVCVKLEGGVGRAHIVKMEDGVASVRNLFDANVPLLPGFEVEKGFVF